ncbi:MAG: alkaline phosphatase D family protein [Acidimicrobiales bacterium]
MSPTPTIGRRQFLAGTLSAGSAALVTTVAPTWVKPSFAFIRSGAPLVTHGVQSGDVTSRTAVVWARADRRGKLLVDVSTSPSFDDFFTVRGPVAGAGRDFTAKVEIDDLPAGRDVFYRARFVDRERESVAGEPVVGQFRTAPALTRPRDVSFVWSGDTAGQGWGINPEFGGMRTYETMRQLSPDFFLHSGDTIYADGPLVEEVPLPDGSIWRNIVTPEKAAVAQTLAEFRGNFRYNLLDENVRRFNAEVPVLAQWDDHETVNNWYPGEVLTDPRYTETDADVLAARARQAFHEYFPTSSTVREPGRVFRRVRYGPDVELFVIDMRTYRGPNTANDQPVPGDDTAILGRVQLDWLQRELRASRVTWKVIASDMPIGLVVPDGTEFEAVAQGRPEALGRELEIAELLSGLRADGVRNVVWLTADVHYAAAHHYDPARAVFTDFSPFWEFVAGPLNAGTFGPNPLDPTFGPEVRFQRAADFPNQPPSDGLQFFGHASMEAATRVMTVRLMDMAGSVLHEEELVPEA